MDGLNSSGSATLAESDIEQELPCLRPLLGSVAKLTDASSDYSPAQVTCSMQRYQLQVSFCRKTALGSIESCLTQHMHEDLEGTLGFLRARLYPAMPLRAGLSRWLSHYEIDAIQSALQLTCNSNLHRIFSSSVYCIALPCACPLKPVIAI